MLKLKPSVDIEARVVTVNINADYKKKECKLEARDGGQQVFSLKTTHAVASLLMTSMEHQKNFKGEKLKTTQMLSFIIKELDG